MNEIEMIPAEMLMHHPDNPRKDLGDLEELTASIKANGVMQNLTVVRPDNWKAKDGDFFWVLIGNRRMEAAIRAGLLELPCQVVRMDRKKQIATMLEENMQRTDLTIYEQAEGFQMMIDLGYTEKEIGEKTGFSAKTVKDRLKLTKLSKDHFSDAVGRGATLLDLVEVTKLERKEDQDKVMRFAGTDNFRKEILEALSDQKFRKKKERLEPVLKEFMTELPKDDRYKTGWERSWSHDFDMTGSEDDLREHIKHLMDLYKDVHWKYYFWHYGQNKFDIEFFHDKPKPEPAPAGELTERQKSIRRGKHLRYVQSFWEEAYDLRKDFVKNFTPQDKASQPLIAKILIKYALDETNDYNGKVEQSHEWNDAYIREVLGLPEDPVESGQKDPKRPYHTDYFTIWEQLQKKHDIPQARILLAWAVGGGIFCADNPEHGLYDCADGHYMKNASRENGVKRLYEFLQEIGYRLSDMEKQLLDGTHECYQLEAGV